METIEQAPHVTPAPQPRVPCPTCHGTGLVQSDEELGAEAHHRRLEAGLSQAALARRMGISRPYLADLELGRRKWNSELLAKLEHALTDAEPDPP